MAGKSGRILENKPKRSLKNILFSWEGVLLLIFILVNIYCASISENYLIKNIFREMPKYITEMFLVLPMAFILILGEIDISVGANVCLSATMACLASNQGLPFFPVFLICLAVGALCGFINGVILAYYTELPPMIVTLATQIIFRGIAEIALGSGGSIALFNFAGFELLNKKFTIGGVRVPLIFFVVSVLMIGFAIVLSKTVFGRNTYAIGSNRLAAFFSGIPVNGRRIFIYTLTGLMAGLSAIFLTGITGGANTTTGNSFEMDAIAMAVFGGISTSGGKGRLFGAIVSAFTITCLRIGLGLINLHPQVILLILGVLLIMSVLIPNVVSNVKSGKRLPK